MNVERYTHHVTASSEDDSFDGAIADFPSLSWLSDDTAAALSGIHSITRDLVEMLSNV